MSDGTAPLREEYEYALSMIACPYYKHGGTCTSGCYSEPSCITDAPIEGWEGLIETYERRNSKTNASRSTDT